MLFLIIRILCLLKTVKVYYYCRSTTEVGPDCTFALLTGSPLLGRLEGLTFNDDVSRLSRALAPNRKIIDLRFIGSTKFTFTPL